MKNWPKYYNVSDEVSFREWLKKKKKFEKWIIPNAFMDAGYFQDVTKMFSNTFWVEILVILLYICAVFISHQHLLRVVQQKLKGKPAEDRCF